MFRRTFVRLAKTRINVVTADKETVVVEGEVGQTLMEAMKGAGLDIEAACDGACACSTCHCYISDKYFDKIPGRSEDEEDMLDMALEPRDTSRLSCQIQLTAELQDLEVELPEDVSSQLA